MADFKITQVTFSYRQDTEVVDESKGTHKRTTYLVCQISFRYKGFNNSEEYGTTLVDLQKLSEITYDANGKYTKVTLTPRKYDTWESLKSVAESAVSREITSIQSQAQEVSHYKRVLGQMQAMKVPSESSVSGDDLERFLEYGNVLTL